MRQLLNLKFGSFKAPPFLEHYTDEMGFTRAIGKLFVKQHFDLLIDLGINISVVLADNIAFGTMNENGTYDGLFKLLQFREVDTVLLPGETFMKSPPGKFGPVIAGAENRILSYALPPTKIDVDVMESVNVFDRASYGYVLGAFVICFMIIRLAHLRRPLWTFVSSLFSQNFGVPNTNRRKLIYGGFIAFLFLLEEIFNGGYSTDLAVVSGEKLIHTLEDLYESDQLPWWYKGDSLYTQFKFNTSVIYGKIWNKAVKAGLKKCLIGGSAANLFSLNLGSGGRMALVASSIYKPVVVNYLCSLWGQSFKARIAKGYSLFYSGPFSTVNYALLMSFNIDQLLEERIIEYSTFMIESGYALKVLSQTGNQLWPTDSECPETVLDKQESLIHVPALGFGRSSALFYRSLYCVVCSTFCCVLEILVRKFIRRRPLRM